MDQLFNLLSPGSAAVAVIVVVAVFLKLVSSMVKANEGVIGRLVESQEKARESYFMSLREVIASNERVNSNVIDRLNGLETAIEGLSRSIAMREGRV